jgi:hypothetical protein
MMSDRLSQNLKIIAILKLTQLSKIAVLSSYKKTNKLKLFHIDRGGQSKGVAALSPCPQPPAP